MSVKPIAVTLPPCVCGETKAQMLSTAGVPVVCAGCGIERAPSPPPVDAANRERLAREARAAIDNYMEYRFRCSDTPGATKELDRRLYEADDMFSAWLRRFIDAAAKGETR